MNQRNAVQVVGLTAYLEPLKLFTGDRRALNAELRQHSKAIATDLLPEVRAAVAKSPAPQARKMAATARVHSDRVPVIVVGKVNPKLSGFRRRGQSAAEAKRRRGSLAAGVLQGGKGGRRDTKADENYYRIPRNEHWGTLGDQLRAGSPLMREAQDLYLRLLLATMRAHGLPRQAGHR